MTLRDWWTVRDPLRWFRIQAAYRRPRFHRYAADSAWSFTFGGIGVCWETRYYRTTGLNIFTENRMWTIWPTTPTAEQNHRLDEWNAAQLAWWQTNPVPDPDERERGS